MLALLLYKHADLLDFRHGGFAGRTDEFPAKFLSKLAIAFVRSGWAAACCFILFLF